MREGDGRGGTRAAVRDERQRSPPHTTAAAAALPSFITSAPVAEGEHARRVAVTEGEYVRVVPRLASGVTGETHHVDAGYNVIGMKAEDAPDIALV